MGKREGNPNCDPTRQPAKPCRCCKLWPPTVKFVWQKHDRRWSSYCGHCRTIQTRKYAGTPARRAACKRYRDSERGKANRLAYEATDAFKARRRAWRATPRAKLLHYLRNAQWQLKQGNTTARRRIRECQKELIRLERRAAS